MFIQASRLRVEAPTTLWRPVPRWPSRQCPAGVGHPLQRRSSVTAWLLLPATPARPRCKWPGRGESHRAPQSLGQRWVVRSRQGQGCHRPHPKARVQETKARHTTCAGHPGPSQTEAPEARLRAAENSQQCSRRPLPGPSQMPEGLAYRMGKGGRTEATGQAKPPR